MGVIEPHGVANLDPRGSIDRIYVGEHQMLIHYTKYIWFQKMIFKVSPIISLWKLLIPNVWSVLTPGA